MIKKVNGKVLNCFCFLLDFQGFTAEQDQPYTRTGFLRPPKAWRIVSYVKKTLFLQFFWVFCLFGSTSFPIGTKDRHIHVDSSQNDYLFNILLSINIYLLTTAQKKYSRKKSTQKVYVPPLYQKNKRLIF